MNRLLLIFIIAGILLAFTEEIHQNPYLTNYFRSPVGHKLVLSGTYGELRGNHFHYGLDIKPKVRNKMGDPIYAVADGYVSRLKIGAFGYGYGLYMNHLNGYTSVYGHLLKYNSTITNYARKKQYEQESFAIDIYPEPDELFFKKGDIIGYLGTSGYSFGPHLHFELRDTKTEVPINPLLFGYSVADTRKPFMQQLKVYDLDEQSEVIADKLYTLKKRKGVINYDTPTDTLYVGSHKVGLGLKVYDQLNDAPNWNGVYAIELYREDSLWYRAVMDSIGFDVTRAINAHVDYKTRKFKKAYFNRCYVLPGNPLKIYQHLADSGVITLTNNQPVKIKIVAKDYAGNTSALQFILKKNKTIAPPSKSYNYFLPYHEESIIRQNHMELYFEKGALYQDLYAAIRSTPDKSSDVFSPVYHIHNEGVPLHKPFEIKIKPTRFIPDSLKTKAYIAQCAGKYTSSYGGIWDGEFLKAKSYNFGDYSIMIDTIPPIVKPSVFKPNMGQASRISFIIQDKISGISDFDAWVDGEWILMTFDGKRKHLYHDFDGRIERGKHQFRLSVVDGRGNETIFEREFTR